MECHACATELPDEARFCPGCGADLRAGQEVRKVVSVVFCDLVGSTSLGERLDPESLRRLTLRYFELMRSCIVRHGGTVEKYIGDAVMAVFGVPVAREDDAMRAVRAAMEMRAAARDLTTSAGGDGGYSLAVRIGVNTGEAVAVADASDGQALVSGWCVNIAARLQQQAPVGEVLIGDTTYQLVKDAVEAESLPPLAVKGSSAGVSAWLLRKVRSDRSPIARRFDVPFCDRHHELRLLELSLEGVVQDRSGHLCTVFGDPGIGKSRLAIEFVARARARGAAVGWGNCRPYGGATLDPLVEALRQLGITEAGLAELLSESDQECVPLLRRLLATGAAGSLAAETFRAVRRLVTAVAVRRPIVVVLDDLHWAEPMLLELVEHLAGRLTDVPVLMLCLARLELVDQRPVWGGGTPSATTITLPPLSAAHSLRLAASLADVTAHHADAGVIERLVAAAGGNPFHLEQLIAMSEEPDGDQRLPATIRALIAARLDRLDPAQRSVLEWAAVLGREFPVRAIEALTEQPADVRGAVDGLTRRRLIEPADLADEDVFRFANQQIHDVAYAALPKRIRIARHRAAAEWLLASQPVPLAEIADHLARVAHYQHEIGDHDPAAVATVRRAGEYLQRAGAAALDRGDLPRARALLQRALALPPGAAESDRLAATARLADVLLATGEPARAGDLLDQVLATPAAAPGTRLGAHARVQRSVLWLAAEPDRASEVATAAIPVFEAAGDWLGLARSWVRLAQTSQAQSQYGAAADRFERALDYAVRAEAELELATAAGGLAACLSQGPHPASAATQRCRELLDRHSGATTRAAVSCPLAILLGIQGQFEEAERLLDQAGAVLTELRNTGALAILPMFRGELAVLAGRWELADRAYGEAQQALRSGGDPRQAAVAAAAKARAIAYNGRWVDAARLLDACGDQLASPEGVEATLAASLRALVSAKRGELENANWWSVRASELAATVDSPEVRAVVLLDQAGVRFAAGQEAAAIRAANAARELFAAKGHAVGVEWAQSALRRKEWP